MANYQIDINVKTRYIDQESTPEANHFVFAYTVTMKNSGDISAKLLTRHWIITDAENRSQEVRGEGVVGEQPYLRPGESYTYSSGTVLETALGFMHGSYQMIADDGNKFDASIPAFRLAIPGVIH